MYAGRTVEEAPAPRRCSPRHSHPYTRGLLGACRDPERRRRRLEEIPGRVPTLRASPDACTFADRCGRADALCRSRRPRLRSVRPDTRSRCVHPRPLPESVRGRRRSRSSTWSSTSAGRGSRARSCTAVDGSHRARRRRDARPGRRVRQRQEHARPLRDPAGPSRPSARSGSTARDITQLVARQLRRCGGDFNIVFQDPASSLNPRMTVAEIVGEPLRLHRIGRGPSAASRVHEMLEQVGLRAGDRPPLPARAFRRPAAARRPGPRAVRRAVAARRRRADLRAGRLGAGGGAQPDRPTAGELGFSCLFITHDLADGGVPVRSGSRSCTSAS